MHTWFGAQGAELLSSLPENIGVYAVVLFFVFVGITALFSLSKRFMQNMAALAAVIVSAFATFLLVGSIYDILLKKEGVQNAINELLAQMPELGASADGVAALSRFVVSLIAIPVLFLIVYGILSLVVSIVFAFRKEERTQKDEQRANKFSTVIKIASGVLTGVVAFVAYFYPSHSFVQLMTLPPILLAAFAVIKGILYFVQKHSPHSGFFQKIFGLLAGGITGAVMFLMLFFPFLALADLACTGMDTVPAEALACYEEHRNEEEETPDLMNKVFFYTVETKKYVDSYEKTFLSHIYPHSPLGSLHGKIAPVEEVRSMLGTTVVLGSYYYCEENGAEFPDADARLGLAINDVVGDKDLNDIIQSLLCEALSQAVCTGEARAEFRAQLGAVAHLAELETLDAPAREAESGRLAVLYRVLCRLMISGKGQEVSEMTGERLVLYGELLDAMKDSYSFSGVPELLLLQLQKDQTVGQYIDPEVARTNVDLGEYTYTDYMRMVAFYRNLIA